MVTATSSAGAAATNTTDTGSNAMNKLGSDYQMFLKLLTTQLQNQDPMNPMDTSQYTQQLVQYSQVEQSIQQNTTLKSILASLGTQNLTQASSLIGRQVETNSAAAGLAAGSPAQWNWSAPRNVSSLVATITDSRGVIVDTRTVDATGANGTFSWDGLNSKGKQADPGTYTVSFKAADSNGTSLTVTPHAIGKVSDVQLANGAVLVTVNGMQVSSSDLVRIG